MLGILSLDTAFPRIIGDVGNTASYECGATVEIVRGAGSPDIVKDGILDEELIVRFARAAKTLEATGARAIVSTCGFLITAQDRIAAEVNIPVMLSALSLYPMVRTSVAKPIGILTASRTALGSAALSAAGIPANDVAIKGMDDCPLFTETFLAPKNKQRGTFDPSQMQQKVVEKAVELVRQRPDVRALLLECGNLPPYAAEIRKATGLPVFHLVDAAHWLVATNRSAGSRNGMST